MVKNLKFLRISSVIIKIVAWIFLLMGVVGGITILSGYIADHPRWVGMVIIVFYSFCFLFFYTVAVIADLIVEMKKEDKTYALF